MNPERCIPIEAEPKTERPTAILLDIYETTERNDASKIQGTIISVSETLGAISGQGDETSRLR